MDSLAGVEPQLIIPFILVVGAVLVYIFGFKQTDEPSYEQLAVLQSSNSYKDKHHRSGATNNPKQQSNKNSAASSAATSAKPKTNGHLPSNGTVKKAAPAPAPSTSSAGGKTEGHKNNENKPPVVQAAKKSVKDPANKPEDFESGDWIPAVSRKDKAKKPKEAPASPGKKAGGKQETTTSFLPIDATSGSGSPVKAPKIEDLLAEMNVLKEIEKQNHSTQTSPDKKKIVAEEKTKKVQPPPPATGGGKAKVKVVPTEAATKNDEEEVANEVSAPPAVVTAQEKKAAEEKPKSNIAFDEMSGGDSWEEAKSRGAKKRRTRKD